MMLRLARQNRIFTTQTSSLLWHKVGYRIQSRNMSATRYAKEQPEGFRNAIEKVAVVGAAGTIGSHIVSALLQTGKHTVTALTRKSSTNKLPPGVQAAPIDYDDEASIVSALAGQQFFIITMSPAAPRDSHSKLVQAAAKAGVPYVMPNWYSGDVDNVQLGADTFIGPAGTANREEIEKLGMGWIAVCCGFWYEYSLSGGDLRFGFDFAKRTLTLFDDGNTLNSTTSLGTVGRAVARVLSLKELPEDADDQSLTLASFRNKAVYVKSFDVTQNDMFRSVKRVTCTTDADWTVTPVSSKQRYEEGVAELRGGNPAGFVKALYSRGFFPGGGANQHSAKAQNELLGLSADDLDECTRAGVELAKENDPRMF